MSLAGPANAVSAFKKRDSAAARDAVQGVYVAHPVSPLSPPHFIAGGHLPKEVYYLQNKENLRHKALHNNTLQK